MLGVDPGLVLHCGQHRDAAPGSPVRPNTRVPRPVTPASAQRDAAATPPSPDVPALHLDHAIAVTPRTLRVAELRLGQDERDVVRLPIRRRAVAPPA
jgi:hypothetical protein